MFRTLRLATAFLLVMTAPAIASAEKLSRVNCAGEFAKLVPATPIPIDEAKQLTVSAWQVTARYLRQNKIADTEENREKILSAFDRALSHMMTPLGSARQVRNQSGLRVVDAPHLEELQKQGVPEYVVKHLTVDHHGVFGKGLPANVNSTTQILDRLDPANSEFVQPKDFDRSFSKFSSDNVGDAFGLARAVVRHAAEIRANPRLRERLREIAVAEDFGIFGPGLELDASDTIPALLRMNDRMLNSIGRDRTFMDRVNLGFGRETANAIQRAGDDYDRILFPRNEADRSFARSMASEFRKNVELGMSAAEKVRIPISTRAGNPAPIFFAETTSLGGDSGPFFQSRVIIPQLVRKLEKSGVGAFERNFSISGESSAATRTVICANFPGRGSSMLAPMLGRTKSFLDAYIAAENKAIEARLPALRQMGGEALSQAEARQKQIREGTWRPQSLANGSLIFGATYMSASDFKDLVVSNLDLLGYN